MRAKQILAWTGAVLLSAAAVGLLHALLGVVNPLLGMTYFDLLFLFGSGVALAFAVIIGVPVALLYRSQDWTNLIGVLIGGFLIGALPFAMFAAATRSLDWSFSKLIALYGGYGALGALVFRVTLQIFGALPAKHSAEGNSPKTGH